MSRFFFEVSYTGTSYHGWQNQPNANTVQGEIESCFAKFIPDFIGITGSGRTDRGVHCMQQFFHTDLEECTDTEELKFKLNCMLPPSISILNIQKVKTDAHARFDAISRSYLYIIDRQKDPFKAGLVYWFQKELRLNEMNEACDILMKHEDFESFSRVRTDVNHFKCSIMEAHWTESGSKLEFRITANRFLRGMVRAIVGTMLEIGQGKRHVNELEQTILSHDRKQAGPAVTPEGLFLYSVKYPDHLFAK